MVEWRERASCAGEDPDIFFPDTMAQRVRAQMICDGCPVQIECAVYAIENDAEFGIWGGRNKLAREFLAKQAAIGAYRPSVK